MERTQWRLCLGACMAIALTATRIEAQTSDVVGRRSMFAVPADQVDGLSDTTFDYQPAQSPSPRLSPPQKGAIIGAASGLGVGLTFASILCDGAHCYALGYVRAAAVFAAAGAGIGALIGAAIQSKQRPTTPSHRFGVCPVLSSQMRGVVVDLRF